MKASRRAVNGERTTLKTMVALGLVAWLVAIGFAFYWGIAVAAGP